MILINVSLARQLFLDRVHAVLLAALDVVGHNDGVQEATINLVYVDPGHTLVSRRRRVVLVHALLDEVQVADSDVGSADVAQVLVAGLLRPVRITQLVVAKYLDLLLILGLVALLYTLRRLHGEGKRRAAQSKDRVLRRRRLIRALEEWGLEDIAGVPSLLRGDLEHVFHGQQRLLANARQVLLQILLRVFVEYDLTLLGQAVALAPLVSLRRAQDLKDLVNLVELAGAWEERMLQVQLRHDAPSCKYIRVEVVVVGA